MACVITMFSAFLTTGTALAEDQFVDGTYQIDGGKDTNDGSASVADGGTKIHFVSEGGEGATWTWSENEKAYIHDQNSDLKLEVSDKGDGNYEWKVTDTSNNTQVDQGTATKNAVPTLPGGGD